MEKKLKTELEGMLLGVRPVIEPLERAIAQLSASRITLEEIDSVSKGIYDELDKLAKKAPAESVTNLMLGQVNDIINEAKKLMSVDRYVQKLNIFVAAGENPEIRDALLMIRQIRDGLARFGTKSQHEKSTFTVRLRKARTIVVALECYIEFGNSPSKSLVELNLKSEPWVDYFNYNGYLLMERISVVNPVTDLSVEADID